MFMYNPWIARMERHKQADQALGEETRGDTHRFDVYRLLAQPPRA